MRRRYAESPVSEPSSTRPTWASLGQPGPTWANLARPTLDGAGWPCPR